jgi:hypothetical protein
MGWPTRIDASLLTEMAESLCPSLNGALHELAVLPCALALTQSTLCGRSHNVPSLDFPFEVGRFMLFSGVSANRTDGKSREK